MNKNWNDRADKDLFFTILSVKNIGVISGSEWTTIGNHMRTLGYGFTNEGCRYVGCVLLTATSYCCCFCCCSCSIATAVARSSFIAFDIAVAIAIPDYSPCIPVVMQPCSSRFFIRIIVESTIPGSCWPFLTCRLSVLSSSCWARCLCIVLSSPCHRIAEKLALASLLRLH